MGKADAYDSDPDSPARAGVVHSGDSESTAESHLEAPRRVRSAAQIAAFEKARAARRAKLEARSKSAPPDPAGDPAGEETETAPEPPAAPAKKARKPRSDKGKKRGYLVRTAQANEAERYDEAPQPQQHRFPQGNHGYGNFIIV